MSDVSDDSPAWISGAAYAGVHNTRLLVLPSGCARPKSQTCTEFPANNMFAGFTSPCRIWCSRFREVDGLGRILEVSQ